MHDYNKHMFERLINDNTKYILYLWENLTKIQFSHKHTIKFCERLTILILKKSKFIDLSHSRENPS